MYFLITRKIREQPTLFSMANRGTSELHLGQSMMFYLYSFFSRAKLILFCELLPDNDSTKNEILEGWFLITRSLPVFDVDEWNMYDWNRNIFQKSYFESLTQDFFKENFKTDFIFHCTIFHVTWKNWQIWNPTHSAFKDTRIIVVR